MYKYIKSGKCLMVSDRDGQGSRSDFHSNSMTEIYDSMDDLLSCIIL